MPRDGSRQEAAFEVQLTGDPVFEPQVQPVTTEGPEAR
jgi:hypothetical protein